MFIKARKDIWFWGLAFLAIMLFCPHASFAEKSKITVNKSVIDLSAKSGQDVEFSFAIRNDSQEKQKINLEVRDIALEDNNIMTIIDAQSGPSGLVSFSKNDFVLEPNEKEDILGVMRLSEEKQEASFYNMLTMISFSSAEEKDDASGPQIQGKIGIYTFIKIGERHNASGVIEGVSFPVFIKGEQQIEVVYANAGDVYFVPGKEVWIRNLLTGSQQNIILDSHFVFPGKKVIFSGKNDNISPWGIFRLKVKFIDGSGGMQIKNRYACGYLFPVGLLLGLPVMFFLTILILRKRNQVKIELLEKS